MNRREFLKNLNRCYWLAVAASTPGISLLFPEKAFASSGARHFFVMIRLEGGWDVTLGLDPIRHSDHGSDQNDIFVEYSLDNILFAEGLMLGPACAPLVPHVRDIAVINGVFMSGSNVSHESNLDYISTGNSEGGSADLPVEIAQSSTKGPLGIVFSGNLKRAGRDILGSEIRQVEALKNAMKLEKLEAFLHNGSMKSDLRRAALDFIASADSRARLIESLEALSGEIARAGSSSGSDVVPEMRRSAAVIAASFISGGAVQGQITVRPNLDTHANHEGQHLQTLTNAFDGVANVFRIFKCVPYEGKSLFDYTTFAVVSEFARTPALNAAGGKDHNPLTNSVLLAGAGIRGGQSLGSSRVITRRQSKNGEPRHVACPIEFTTGRVAKTRAEASSPEFQFIFPENVAATLAEAVGADREKFASVRTNVPALRRLLRD